DEARVMDAYEYAQGFKGLNRLRIDGSDFFQSYETMGEVTAAVRRTGEPWLVQAQTPLLGHHTSGVRRETFRDNADMQEHSSRDPLPRLKTRLLALGVAEEGLHEIHQTAIDTVRHGFQQALAAPEPDPATVTDHVFAPTPVTEETGVREPAGGNKVLMVDAALFAIREIMEDNPEALLYGQ